jgi:hypothetical protein
VLDRSGWRLSVIRDTVSMATCAGQRPHPPNRGEAAIYSLLRRVLEGLKPHNFASLSSCFSRPQTAAPVPDARSTTHSRC